MVITTHLRFAAWVQVFGDAKLTTALLDRITHYGDILETGNDSYRFKQRKKSITPPITLPATWKLVGALPWKLFKAD